MSFCFFLNPKCILINGVKGIPTAYIISVEGSRVNSLYRIFLELNKFTADIPISNLNFLGLNLYKTAKSKRLYGISSSLFLIKFVNSKPEP